MPLRFHLSIVLVGSVLLLAVADRAHALTQPDGTVIPTPLSCAGQQPVGLPAVFACQCDVSACNIGAPCLGLPCDDGQHATCETTLWHVLNDNTCIPSRSSGLDAIADASLEPATLYPAGLLRIQLASRSGSFQSALCWYNATGAVPLATDLHAVLPCWATIGSEVSLDLTGDPAYLGGAIGFALVSPESHAVHGTCAGGDCCASVSRWATGTGYAYYTENQYNADHSGSGASVIHMIVYRSRLASDRIYLAAEDLYGGGSNSFTAFVARIRGVATLAVEPGPAERSLHLYPAEPNPFRPPATIRFDLPTSGRARLALFDLAGRRIRTLIDSSLPAGAHETTWDGRDGTGQVLAPGTYFVRLATDAGTALNRMCLVR